MKRKAAIQLIPLDLLDIDKNVRQGMNDEALEELAESIRSQGLLQPITVQEKKETGRFQVILGHRRCAAYRMLRQRWPQNWQKIPSMVVVDLDPANLEEIQLVENLQREDLKPLDIYEALMTLRQRGYSIRAIAGKMGKSEGHVKNLFSALKSMDETQEIRTLMEENQGLTLSDLQEIRGLEPWTQVSLLKARIVGDIPSVAALRQRVATIRQGRPSQEDTGIRSELLRLGIRGKRLSFPRRTIDLSRLSPQERQSLKETLANLAALL